MRTPQRVLCVAAVLLLVAAVGGCSLKKAPPYQRGYVLEASRPAKAASAAEGVPLVLQTLEVSPQFSGSGFVYRKRDGSWESDFYNQFFILPAYQVTDQIRKWLAGTEYVQTVVTSPGFGSMHHTLTGNVSALYGDYTTTPARGVLEIEFVLLDGERKMLFSRAYLEQEPVAGKGPDALVEAWNAAFSRVLAALEEDLRGILAGD